MWARHLDLLTILFSIKEGDVIPQGPTLVKRPYRDFLCGPAFADLDSVVSLAFQVFSGLSGFGAVHFCSPFDIGTIPNPYVQCKPFWPLNLDFTTYLQLVLNRGQKYCETRSFIRSYA